MWGWTAAQIQLMNIDASITVYKKEEKDNKEETVQEKREKMDAIVEQWKRKKRNGTGSKLSDFLGGKLNTNNV